MQVDELGWISGSVPIASTASYEQMRTASTRDGKREKMCRRLLGATGLIPGDHKTLPIRQLLDSRESESSPRIPIGKCCGMTSCHAAPVYRDSLSTSRLHARGLSDVLLHGPSRVQGGYEPQNSGERSSYMEFG